MSLNKSPFRKLLSYFDVPILVTVKRVTTDLHFQMFYNLFYWHGRTISYFQFAVAVLLTSADVFIVANRDLPRRVNNAVDKSKWGSLSMHFISFLFSECKVEVMKSNPTFSS